MKDFIRKNLANFITALRFPVAIAILIVYFGGVDNWLWICVGLFLFGCFTDVIDGTVARLMNSVSEDGMLLDPLCDKSMQLSMLFVLSMGGYVKWWMFTLIAIKEALLIIGGIFLKGTKIIVKSNWVGKFATVFFTASVIAAIFRWAPYSDYMMFASVVLMFISLTQYAVKYIIQFNKQTADSKNK